MNKGNVTGTLAYIGGIIGSLWGTVNKCYNEGEVMGLFENCIEERPGDVGGIVGVTGQNCTAVIENCYNRGNITVKGGIKTEAIGGILGWVSATGTEGTISNNYNIGMIEVEANVVDVGGVIGHCTTKAFTIEHNYYQEGTCNMSTNTMGEVKSADYMKKQDFVNDLNAGQEETVWEKQAGKNEDYPVIIGME